MPATLIFERKGSFLIQLYQSGPDKFRVCYGFQEWKGNYEYAARKLGEALMHDLACEGKLDASDDDIESAIERSHA